MDDQTTGTPPADEPVVTPMPDPGMPAAPVEGEEVTGGADAPTEEAAE